MKILHFMPLIVLCCLGNTIGNPGVLITIPFPLSPPMIQIPLPLGIDNIVINNLQLTNILLKKVQYVWKFNSANAQINITQAQISFDWFYKNDKGKGSLTEANLRLDMFYSFVTSKSNHFQVSITSTKIHPGHSKVILGGGVPEILIVQVTNLILNHASILFRSFIANKISQTITQLVKTIGQDRLIFQDLQSKKEFYLNATLVAFPSISSNTLIIQLDGAPYIKGIPSGPLNPPNILVRGNSTKIDVQIHKIVANNFLNLLIEARGGDIGIELHTVDITSVIDVTSLLLSPIFPKMAQFADERDVIMQIKIPSIELDFSGDNIRLLLKMYTPVITHNSIEKRNQLYMQKLAGTAMLQILPILFRNKCSARIDKFKVLEFEVMPNDVEKGLVIPEAITGYLDFLTGWLADGINLALNRKVYDLAYKNIQIALKGSAVKDVAYNLEIDFMQ